MSGSHDDSNISAHSGNAQNKAEVVKASLNIGSALLVAIIAALGEWPAHISRVQS